MSSKKKEGRGLDLTQEEERKLIKEEFENTYDVLPKGFGEETTLEDIDFKLASVVNLLSVIARQNDLMLRKLYSM